MNWSLCLPVGKEPKHLVIRMNKREGVLVTQEAVDSESRLVANTEPALREHVQALSLQWDLH